MKACILTVVHVHNDNRIFYKQLPALLEAGYQITYVVPCPAELKMDSRVELIPLPQIPRWRRFQNWGKALAAALRSGADIFHFHDPELIPVGLVLRALTRRPVIYDVHENNPQVVLRRLWIPRLLRVPAAKGMALLEWLACRFLDGIVVANPPTAERIYRFARRAVQVANYVELAHFDTPPQTPSLAQPDGPSFIYSGSLSTQRGVLDCLQAFELLNRPDARLTLVGPLDDADPSMADLPRRLPPRVRLLPPQPFANIPPLLRSSLAGLVTLHPTPNYLEIIPTKLLEYMAAAIPVIAYDLPLVRPIVKQSKCGILIEPQDVRAMAEAMAYILDHPEDAKEMGRRGREAVEEKFCWESEKRKLLALYQGLLSPRRGQ